MFDLSPAAIGLLLISLGLAFTLLTLGIMRLLPRLQATQESPPQPTSDLLAEHHEAVVLVQSGGRVTYMNPAAHELFNTWEDTPDLESLARRARPSPSFLMLCAAEGQARFSLNGQFVAGSSYYTPGGVGSGPEYSSAILVSIRRIPVDSARKDGLPVEAGAGLAHDLRSEDGSGSLAGQASAGGAPSQAFGIIFELTQAMAASLDLETTLRTVLESVERLFPSDFLEITLWEAEVKHLVPYRLVGLAGIDRRLEIAPERYHADQGYSGYLITHRQALLVKDVNTYRSVRPEMDRQRYPIQSYIGAPLLLAGELIGTLELASLARASYTESDLEALRLLAGQAVVAVNNALLYRKEQQRSMELQGLANLAQSTTAVREPQELYTHLIQSIARLVDVEVLGFLIYDENRRLLEGQRPFIGLPPSILEWCQASIPHDSPAEAVWKTGESIVTSEGATDERIQAYGLHHLALAAGIHATVLIPLTASGRMLGYLQAANKRDGAAFDAGDVRFLSIIAGQAAPMIENLALVENARRRAQRAETLRRIASLTSSAATIEEILKYSVLDLARLLQVDTATIFLIDDNRGALRLHRSSMFGVPPDASDALGRIPTEGFQFVQTVSSSKQPYTSGNVGLPILSTDPAGLPETEQPAGHEGQPAALYRPLIDQLKIHSVMIAPLIVRERGMGELFMGSFRPDFFSAGDMQTISTACDLIAGAIDRAELFTQTDNSLRQRIDQLVALTRVSRELNTTIRLEDLLQRVYDEALLATRADCGSISLFDLDSAHPIRPLVLPKTGSLSTNSAQTTSACILDQEPETLFHFGDKVAGGLHPLELKVLLQAESLIIDDLNLATSESQPAGEGVSEVSFAHSGVRSALVAPIAYQGQVAGLIRLHSRSPHHFGDAEREVSEALAIQAAIALGNTRRFQEQRRRSQELNQRVETLSKIFDVAQAMQSEQPLEQTLELIAYAIRTATPFDRILFSLYDPAENHLVRKVGAGIPQREMEELRACPAPWKSIRALMEQRFSLGRSYFIPAEYADVVPEDVLTYPPRSGDLAQAGGPPEGEVRLQRNRWHTDDLWIMPLIGTGNEPLGLLSVDEPRNNLRPDRPTIEAVEIFGNQAALILENQIKLQNMRGQIVKVREELTLREQAAQATQDQLLTLSQKEGLQTQVIRDLEQRLRRMKAGLEIIEIISQKRSRSEVLHSLGQEILARMGFDTVLIAEASSGGVDLAYTLGAIPEGVNPKVLLGQRNPLRQCLQTGESLLSASLSADDDWQNTPFLRALEASSALCLPVTSTGQATGWQASAAMLAIGRSPTAPFDSHDRQLFDLLRRQVTITLQNLSLLEEASRRLKEVSLLMDFSRQLGSLDPTSILTSLVESALHAVPAAQTAMVALWDPRLGLLAPQASVGYLDGEELTDVRYRPGEGLPGQAFEQRQALLLEEVDFARHYNLSAENLLHFRNATGGRFPVSSLAAPILTGGLEIDGAPDSPDDSPIVEGRVSPLGVLVLDSAQTTSAFSKDDLALISSLAQQTALTLENARLYQASRQRSNQLQQLTRVATTISSSLQTDELVNSLLDQLQAILPYDTGTLWLREQGEAVAPGKEPIDRMIIRAALGFEDRDQRLGLAVDVQDSELLNEMIQTGRSIWVANVRNDTRFRALSFEADLSAEIASIEASALVETEQGFDRLSWLGVPLILTGQVIGVIALEKTEAGFYSSDDIQMAATFAGQAAIGLENARLYQESLQHAQELNQRTETLSILNRLSYELSGSLDAARILDYAVREFTQLMNCTSASALVIDRGPIESFAAGAAPGSKRILLQAEYPYFEGPSAFYPGKAMPVASIFERLQETQGIFNTDDVDQEPELAPLKDFLDHHKTLSLLIVPIISGGGSDLDGAERHFRGMLLAHQAAGDVGFEADGRGAGQRFSPDEVELARTISNQVAIALQNAQLLEETLSLTDDLEIRVQERTIEVARERQRAETLLRIITELSASLDLEQVLQRTLQVLSEFVDAAQITILVARSGEKKLKRLASIGYAATPESQPMDTPFDVDQGLAGWVISKRQSALIGDVLQDERWVKILYPDDQAWRPVFQHRSAMGVPLTSGAEALGCLLLFHPEVDHFSTDQLDLVQAAVNQVAVAVNNAELYRLIRDQAEDLGSMLRVQQVEASRSKAILEAVADGVLVTDASRSITLFNEQAEMILGLERQDVLGKSLKHFAGLFGPATHRWMEAIDTWSRHPGSLQSGEVFSEQITLEDGRVISVHLSPVSLRDEFMGTVSIFQDITHQVELDRLKSEFVATVSHELRTPMTSIKGYVDMLLMRAAGPLTEQQSHFLQVVKTNTERLGVLVNDLLDISQIESGQAVLAVEPVDLDDIAEQAIGELKRQIGGSDKGVSIEKLTQPDLPHVFADPERVRRVLGNLLDNAFQYNLPGGRILLRLRPAGDQVQVDVQDSGVGIPEEDRERIFERFFRGESTLNLGVAGTGLGLSIVQHLVEMQNGRIWLESTGIRGEGSTFSFTLPACTTPARDSKRREGQPEAPVAEPGGSDEMGR